MLHRSSELHILGYSNPDWAGSTKSTTHSSNFITRTTYILFDKDFNTSKFNNLISKLDISTFIISTFIMLNLEKL